MRWWVRLIITFVVMLLFGGLFELIARLAGKWPSDNLLLSEFIGLPGPFLFALLYYHLPRLLGRPRPVMASESPGHSRRWLSAWWWKWVLIGVGSFVFSMNEIGRAVWLWQLPPPLFRKPGFPSALSPEFRSFLVLWHNGLVRVSAVGMCWFAIYLFWRDWKQPKHEPGKNCIECGYDLTGNMSGVCPECGGKI